MRRENGSIQHWAREDRIYRTILLSHVDYIHIFFYVRCQSLYLILASTAASNKSARPLNEAHRTPSTFPTLEK